MINSIYLTKKVKQHVTDLIHDYNYSNYEDLSYSDKCEFTAHLIDAAGKNSEHEFLLESNDLDKMIGAFKKSLLGNYEDDENLMFIMKENAINYFEQTMQNIFEYIFEDYEQERNGWVSYEVRYGSSDDAYESYRECL